MQKMKKGAVEINKREKAMEEERERKIILLMKTELPVSSSCLDFVSVCVVFGSLVSVQYQISPKAVRYSKKVCSGVSCSG